MINCLLVDDEPYALELLCKYIAEFNDMVVIARCRSVQQAIPVLMSEPIDLLFLDVKMPKVSGMEFLAQVPDLPGVILTTAYRGYAVQAYEYGVLDYLVKPISFIRFAKAVERFRQKQAGNKTDEAMNIPIVFKSGFEYHKIVPADILYIQSVKEYVSIICSSCKYLVRSSMSDILAQLPDGGFIQVHKSYIAPVEKIVSVSTSGVLLLNDMKIPLGRSFSHPVKALFSQR